ncbi:MAG TPA: trypsin-like peptidase domain-containing protein [Chloroflexota bacterium]|jgi:S1-C subfamily serine protease|nr:trypsin-like peptidase domain-containing protein [Chloroflexota bacterium]
MAVEGSNALAAFSEGLASAVATAGQSVVRVEARQRQAASGIIWAEGLVVTADHVVERDDNISIGLANGQSVAATLLGRAPDNDLALLRLSGGESRPAATAAVALRPGSLVLAVARPDADGVQASWGVVSAVGGPVRTRRGGMLAGYIRSGVTMYPGFSGGALVNAQGQIVGLLSSHLGGDSGMAVPAEVVTRLVGTLQQHGRIQRAYLGFRSQPVPIPAAMAERLGRQQESGLLVLSVETGSPAESAGLLIGDIIVAFGGQTLQAPDDLQALLATTPIGTATTLALLRGGQPLDLPVTPTDRPQ